MKIFLAAIYAFGLYMSFLGPVQVVVIRKEFNSVIITAELRETQCNSCFCLLCNSREGGGVHLECCV